jgi:hypothetical protein
MRHAHFLLLWLFLWAPAWAHAGGPSNGDYKPDPASVERYGPAYRYPQAGWIVLHIEGEPYERGVQHGRLMANEIAAHLRCFAQVLTPSAAAEGWQHTRRLTNALFLRRFEKEFLEEMKGIADGATAAGGRIHNRPIDLVDIVALNCWPEIETLDGALEALPTGLEGIRFPHAQPKAMPKPRPEHCSAFAATGPATADGKIVFGHITMFSLYPANFYNVWLDIKPAKGQRVFMCAYPGAMQSGMDYYMNDAGLLIAETTIGQTRFEIKGQSEASRIRQASQYAKTIDEAVAILKKDNNGLYTNEWLLGDTNTNEIALFELGTHKSKLHRSSKNEWIGGTTGFYWGCNNTKDLEVRLETIASVAGRPHNLVFRPSDRDQVWQKLYHKHKGKIGVDFGKEAFTTPTITAFSSLDAKFTTTDLAKELKSWALFGPPRGHTWQPTFEQRQRFPEIKPLVSNPWTILHGNPPPAGDVVAVDVPGGKPTTEPVAIGVAKRQRNLQNVPAWHGTLLPASDADIWLAAAFADYERIVAREKTMGNSPADREALALDLYAFRNSYLMAARARGDVPLADIKADVAQDDWYRIASGKGVLVLCELRRLLGETKFEEMMDSFGRENAGKRVTTAQFQAHAERSAGKSLVAFFDSWLKESGLPALRLGEVTAIKSQPALSTSTNGSAAAGNYRVRGEILQEGNGPALSKVEVTVETTLGDISKTVELNGSRTAFTIDAGTGSPKQVILEKYGNTLQTKASPFTISSFFREQDQTLIVYGTGDELATNREAAQALQKGIRESGANFTVPIKSDKQVTDADLKANHLLLIGRPDSNALVARFRTNLPIQFGQRSFVVRGKTYANAGSAVVAAAENPLNKAYSLVVLAGLNAESTWNTPAAFLRQGRRAAEVLVLPSGGTGHALVVPARELVRELK